MLDKAKSTKVPDRHFESGFAAPTRLRRSSNAAELPKLKWEPVNEVTIKLTDGEGSNVPACHGHWGGYRTTRAIAWVICIAPGKWLARYDDQCASPSSLSEAKAKALAMVKREITGFVAEDPVARLNRMTARLLDRMLVA